MQNFIFFITVALTGLPVWRRTYIIYIIEDIPSKLLVIVYEESVEAIFIKINGRKRK